MNSSPLHGRHIVITRPIGQAGKLSTLIKEAGGESVLFPLIEIAPLGDYQHFVQSIRDLARFDWAIFISSNAVQNGMPFVNQLSLPASLKFAAIGPSTAAELATFGINHTLIPEGRFDSESLLALPEMQSVKHQKVMIFRGVGGREVLADTLKSRGAEVHFAECYQRINPQKDLTTLTALTQKVALDAIVITSSEAMRHLLSMANHQDWLKNVKLCVNHARISEAPIQSGFNVFVATAPGDDAMLACLVEALNH
jgi:uroporphyrinogen-III synthase